VSALSDLNREMANCRQCELARQRTRVVPGEGAEDAAIAFIGEAPGWHEDQQGRPFVGPAGQFLEELLASISLKRSQVYICNVLKCRPPGNRDPQPTEMATCQTWLDRQLQLLHPRMIVTLGRYSMARFFPGETISRMHGKARREGGVIYFAMYHPAAALHQQKLRDTIKADMLKIPPLLADAAGVPEPKPAQQPQQLSLL
jgi:uracil-DNA glycosylase family 4